MAVVLCDECIEISDIDSADIKSKLKELSDKLVKTDGLSNEEVDYLRKSQIKSQFQLDLSTD